MRAGDPPKALRSDASFAAAPYPGEPSDTAAPGQPSLFGDAPPARPTTRARGARASGPIGPAHTLLALPRALLPYRDLLHLGTSSWSFPGWHGLVYEDSGAPIPESRLSRDGLPAYASHPLLRAVGIDRGFYAPLAEADYAHHAGQVPPGFRFLVKAPGQVTDAVRRDGTGRPSEPNPGWLDPGCAFDTFIAPARSGLGPTLGTLLFQLSPMPAHMLADPAAWVASLRRFLSALPRTLPTGAAFAVELRDPALLTPRFIDMLRDEDIGYCIGLHDRMPPIERQLRAHARLHRGRAGPLVVRWTLRRGIGYEAARRRYAPFRDLLDADPTTREALASEVAATLIAGQPVTVIANNKAEGSAPLTLAALAEAIARRL
jgi:uncharacterized protein YecE (DUF72 family)